LPTELVTREQFNLDILFNTFPKELVYNFCAIAYSMLGYIHTTEAKAAIRAARLGEKHPMFGKTHTTESIGLIRLNHPNRKSVFVYDIDNKLVGEFLSLREAAKDLKIPRTTLRSYLDTGKAWNNKFLICSSPLS